MGTSTLRIYDLVLADNGKFSLSATIHDKSSLLGLAEVHKLQSDLFNTEWEQSLTFTEGIAGGEAQMSVTTADNLGKDFSTSLLVHILEVPSFSVPDGIVEQTTTLSLKQLLGEVLPSLTEKSWGESDKDCFNGTHFLLTTSALVLNLHFDKPHINYKL